MFTLLLKHRLYLVGYTNRSRHNCPHKKVSLFTNNLSTSTQKQPFPWFRNKNNPEESNLKFSCIQCGRCCKGRSRTQVFLNEAEINDISSYLEIDDSNDFLSKYTYAVKHPNDENQLLISLKSKLSESSNCSLPTIATSTDSELSQLQCVFLDATTNQCSIYEVRPTQCRSYPYWSNNLIGEAEWSAESKKCPGINVIVIDTNNTNTTESNGSNKREKEVLTAGNNKTAAANVSYEEVVLNMIVKEVHNYGVGIDLNYSDSIDTLKQVQQQSEYCDMSETNINEVDEFVSEFMNTNHSQIVYENDYLRVVDTTHPNETDHHVTNINTNTMTDCNNNNVEEEYTFKTSEDLTNLPWQQHNNSNRNRETETDTYRRLEFRNSAHMIQSQSRTLSATDDIVDHSSVSLPVHRVMVNVLVAYLKQTHGAYLKELMTSTNSSSSNSSLNHIINNNSNNIENDRDNNNTASTDSNTSNNTRDMRIGVIGAGGCVLPNHIYHLLTPFLKQENNANNNNNNNTHVQPYLSRLRVDCVDPDLEILEIAQAFFSTTFINALPPATTSNNTNNNSNNNSTKAASTSKYYNPYHQQNNKTNIRKSGLIQYNCVGEQFIKTHVSEICSMSTDSNSWLVAQTKQELDQENLSQLIQNNNDSNNNNTNNNTSDNNIPPTNEYEYDILIIDAYDSHSSESNNKQSVFKNYTPTNTTTTTDTINTPSANSNKPKKPSMKPTITNTSAELSIDPATHAISAAAATHNNNDNNATLDIDNMTDAEIRNMIYEDYRSMSDKTTAQKSHKNNNKYNNKSTKDDNKEEEEEQELPVSLDILDMEINSRHNHRSNNSASSNAHNVDMNITAPPLPLLQDQTELLFASLKHKSGE